MLTDVVFQVKNIDDGRVSFDNLVKIEVKADKESETSSEIIINFMSEEDIDKVSKFKITN